MLEALVTHHSSLFEGLPSEPLAARSRSSSTAQALPGWQPPKPGDDEEEFPMRKPQEGKMAHAASISRGLFTGLKRRASSAKGGKIPTSPPTNSDVRPQSPLSLGRTHSNHSQQSLGPSTQAAALTVSLPPASSPVATLIPPTPGASTSTAIPPQPSPSSLDPDLKQLYATYSSGIGTFPTLSSTSLAASSTSESVGKPVPSPSTQLPPGASAQ